MKDPALGVATRNSSPTPATEPSAVETISHLNLTTLRMRSASSRPAEPVLAGGDEPFVGVCDGGLELGVPANFEDPPHLHLGGSRAGLPLAVAHPGLGDHRVAPLGIGSFQTTTRLA